MRPCALLPVLVACAEPDPVGPTDAPTAEDTAEALGGDELPPTGLCSADGWCWVEPTPHAVVRVDVDGSAPDDVWAVGAGGVVEHFDGEVWTATLPALDGELRGVRVLEPGRPCVFGTRGLLACLEDGAWRDAGLPTDEAILDLARSPGGHLWAVGPTGAWQHDGQRWIEHEVGGGLVAAVADDEVWIARTPDSLGQRWNDPSLVHWDGDGWRGLRGMDHGVALGVYGRDVWLATWEGLFRVTVDGLVDPSLVPDEIGASALTDIVRLGAFRYVGVTWDGSLVEVVDGTWTRTEGSGLDTNALWASGDGMVCTVGERASCVDDRGVHEAPGAQRVASSDGIDRALAPVLVPLRRGGVIWAPGRTFLRVGAAGHHRLVVPDQRGFGDVRQVPGGLEAIGWESGQARVWGRSGRQGWTALTDEGSAAFPIGVDGDAGWFSWNSAMLRRVGLDGAEETWPLPPGWLTTWSTMLRAVPFRELWQQDLISGTGDLVELAEDGERRWTSPTWAAWSSPYDRGWPVRHPVTGATVVVNPDGSWFPADPSDATPRASFLGPGEIGVVAGDLGDEVVLALWGYDPDALTLARWDGVQVVHERLPIGHGWQAVRVVRDGVGRSWARVGDDLFVQDR